MGGGQSNIICCLLIRDSKNTLVMLIGDKVASCPPSTMVARHESCIGCASSIIVSRAQKTFARGSRPMASHLTLSNPL